MGARRKSSRNAEFYGADSHGAQADLRGVSSKQTTSSPHIPQSQPNSKGQARKIGLTAAVIVAVAAIALYLGSSYLGSSDTMTSKDRALSMDGAQGSKKVWFRACERLW